jgi:hypothetical protein
VSGLSESDVGHVRLYALLFDKIAMAGQSSKAAHDDLDEQALQLGGGGRAPLLEHRLALGVTTNPVEHENMQVDIEIGSRTEALNERDRTDVVILALDTRLLDQKGWRSRAE